MLRPIRSTPCLWSCALHCLGYKAVFLCCVLSVICNHDICSVLTQSVKKCSSLQRYAFTGIKNILTLSLKVLFWRHFNVTWRIFTGCWAIQFHWGQLLLYYHHPDVVCVWSNGISEWEDRGCLAVGDAAHGLDYVWPLYVTGLLQHCSILILYAACESILHRWSWCCDAWLVAEAGMSVPVCTVVDSFGHCLATSSESMRCRGRPTIDCCVVPAPTPLSKCGTLLVASCSMICPVTRTRYV